MSRRLLVIMLAGGIAACVPVLNNDNAPCPCGGGAVCCATLGVCMANLDSCPARYPASSNASCLRDADCVRGEVCMSWLVDSQPAGPQVCRRACEPDIDCAVGETCLLALHDGQPLSQAKSTSLCFGGTPPDSGPQDAGPDGPQDMAVTDGGSDAMPDGPPADISGDGPPQCQPFNCAACPANKIGQTFCDGSNVAVCYTALSPECGIICERIGWTCDGCFDAGGVVECFIGSIPDEFGACASSECAQCPVGVDTFCDGNVLKGCFRSAINAAEEPCTEVCAVRSIQTCAGGCAAGPGGASCN